MPTSLIVTLAREWEYGAAVASSPDFQPPELPEPGSDPFVGVTISIYEGLPQHFDAILAHELGHAVFDLADKYGFDQFGYDGAGEHDLYPACAANQAEAEEFFGDLIGVVDPFFDEYLETPREADLVWDQAHEQSLRDLVTVDYVTNGCWGPECIGIRSTVGGLMYDQDAVPVMGAVNRRWAEAVLATWSGS